MGNLSDSDLIEGVSEYDVRGVNGEIQNSRMRQSLV